MTVKRIPLQNEVERLLAACVPDEVQAAEEEYAGIGTEETGYVGPEFGPFRCDNCEHFKASTEVQEMGLCDHPEVIADPGVTKCKDGDKAWVHQAACCNEFRTRSI